MRGKPNAPGELLTALRAQPFVPFRIVMVDGVAYEVRHPDMAVVAQRTAHVGVPRPGAAGPAVRVDIVNLGLVARLEPIEAGAATA